jgi:hypothetical protein
VVPSDLVSGAAVALPFRVLLGLSSMFKSTGPVLDTVVLPLRVLLGLLGLLGLLAPLDDPFFDEPAI